MHKYVAVITGPKEYLNEELRVERFYITEEDIADCREEGESEEETIEYILKEYRAEWEQRWCHAQLFTEAQYKIIDPDFQV